MTILEVLLLLALIVGAVYHWIVRDSLKCRIGDLEWDLGNLKFASSRQTNAYGQLIAESKQLEHDLEQYKKAAYKWESLFNERASETLTLREHVSRLQDENNLVFNDLEIAKSDVRVLIERISEAKAALR